MTLAEPRPARLDGPSPVSLRQLAKLTRSVAADVRAGSHHVEFNAEERWSVRLLGDDYKDVWLISWTEDQSTELHDHAGSLGALTVVSGALTERFWAPDVGGRPGLRERDLGTGRSVGFPVGHVHDVINTQTEPAISVHAYSPPLTVMNYYDIDAAHALRRVRSVLTDDPEPDAPTVDAAAIGLRTSEPGSARIDALLAATRTRLRRLTPRQAALAAAEGALLVDIRPEQDRRQFGEIPGAVVIDRNVLEWRLDPTSEHRIAEAGDPRRTVVLFCNEGYASSLAAATLREIGLANATDLVGGFHAWAAAGLPVTASA